MKGLIRTDTHTQREREKEMLILKIHQSQIGKQAYTHAHAPHTPLFLYASEFVDS